MNLESRRQLAKQAESWVLEAGRTIRENIHEPLTIDTKSNPNDLVTQMDQQTEQYFATRIKQTYPNHLILSEEGYGDELTSLNGTVWIIDPIDGTMNFVHQKRNFAISIGIYHDGIGEIGLIYNVMEDTLYQAVRGEGAYKNGTQLPKLSNTLTLERSILGLNHYWLCKNRLIDETYMQRLVKTIRGARTYGSAALELASVAEGVLDGYLTISLNPWDIAAGLVLLNEVGGVMTDINGEQIRFLGKTSVFAANNQIRSRIMNEFLKKGKK